MSNYDEKKEWAKAYFDEKEERELVSKQKTEAEEQKKKAAKAREINFALIVQIIAIGIAFIGCYIFVKNLGVF